MPILTAAARIVESRYRILMREACVDVDDLISIGWLTQGRYMKDEENVRKNLFLNAKRVMIQRLCVASKQNIVRQMLKDEKEQCENLLSLL